MLRRTTYRAAFTALAFAALWFFIGAFVLWTPLPRSLGIGAELFGVWLVLFFAVIGVSGGILTLAAVNAAFPPQPPRVARRTAPRRDGGSALWAPGPHGSPAHGTSRRDG
jgi:hypothetical protein